MAELQKKIVKEIGKDKNVIEEKLNEKIINNEEEMIQQKK